MKTLVNDDMICAKTLEAFAKCARHERKLSNETVFN